MGRPKKEEVVEGQENQQSGNILSKILKEYKEEHFNFEERVNWKISTGSLLLDCALEQGGVNPSLLRLCGGNNEGKTPEALEICRNFLTTVDNSKVVWVMAEGRGLTDENKNRCGLKFTYDPNNFNVGDVFVLESNVYELFIKVVKECVLNNPNKHRYCFVVDSIDGLQLRDDKEKEITENNRVAGAPALSKKMLQSLSLGMFKYGHLMVLLSQVTSEIKIDPYAKTANRGGQFSGGNSLLHGSDYIIEYQTSYPSDYILDNPSGKINDGKSKTIGKFCKVILQKSALETSRKQLIQIPIKFGRKPSGIWLEHELSELLLAYEMYKKGGAGWMTLSEDLSNELKQNNLELPEKIQGVDNLRKYLEERQDLVKYLFSKFKKILAN